MSGRMKIVIIGGVAAGPKVGARINRLRQETDITLVEKGTFLSYAGCGLPYYVAGVVKEQKELMSTPVGVVRDSVFFQKVKNIHVLDGTEAVRIDRTAKTVTVRRGDGTEEPLPYDKLVLAVGARPIVPPFEGVGLSNVFTLHRVEDAEGIRALLSQGRSRDAVIVGGGLIGIEMTEALVARGCRVTIVEKLPGILPMLDPEMAHWVTAHLEAKGVRVKTGTTVRSFRGSERVEAVITDRGEIPADLVILAIGVRPRTDLAVEAGLELGITGGIRVDSALRTSDPDIYAVGDCVENLHRITGRPVYVPLGSTANKHGRVAANAICGHPDSFPGVLGTAICKVFDLAVGRTGLGEAQAREAGFDPVVVLSPAPDKAHYYPAARLLRLKLIVDRRSRRLLGVQAVGPGAADKRIDTAAVAISAGLTVDDVAQLDLAYAPPYSAAMDNLITAADIARNKLDGLAAFMTPAEVEDRRRRGEDFVLLDVRTPKEFVEAAVPGSVNIPLGALRERWRELPADKEIVVFCKISLRGYEAARILQARGLTRVAVMDGGVLMWPYGLVSGDRAGEGRNKGR